MFSPIGNLDLGKFLQVIFTNGAMVQVSKSQKEWELISRMRDGNPNGRQRNFLFINSLGYAAAQSRNPNFSASFPAAQKASIAEHTALYKEFDVTVELEYNLWKAASLTPEKYAEPLAKEIELKSIVARRIMGTYLFGDGTGVFGTAASVADTTGAGGSALVTLNPASRGHVRWFQYGDLFLNKQPDGSAQAVAPSVTGTIYAWRVKNVLPKTNQVVLEAVDSAGAVLQLTASNFASGNVFYRVGQQVIPNLSTISDYGSASDVMPGLESLISNDGRIVHGITMSGAASGTILDWNGAQIDVSALQEGLDEVDMRTGKGEFTYKMAVMAPETRAALIESRETDRRFNSVQDTLRGGKGFGYMHDEDTILFTSSEFCPKQRIYVLPEGKQDGNKVISYFGTDFEPVSDPMGNKFHLKPSSAGGHERNIISYMSTRGTLVCHRPAAVLQIRNFVV
jgi:hypothetical protein